MFTNCSTVYERSRVNLHGYMMHAGRWACLLPTGIICEEFVEVMFTEKYPSLEYLQQ